MLREHMLVGLNPEEWLQDTEKQILKFQPLVSATALTRTELEAVLEESKSSGTFAEELLLGRGITRHEILECLSTSFGLPYVEYDESILTPYEVLKRVDLDRLKQALWFPLAIRGATAHVIAADPSDPSLGEEIRKTLEVSEVRFSVALPSDIVRTIENNQDVNPHYSASAGRTSLARLRTWLADHRTLIAQYRTALAKGRTGLAFLRTGISFMSISLVLLRIFGLGYLSVLEGLLFAAGLTMAVDGLLWYIPTRRIGKLRLEYPVTEPTFGTTYLERSTSGSTQVFRRTEPIAGAEELRIRWNRLTPIMKRRFLAIDRTDLADERTILATYRTIMAQSRTGLAFTRTGVAFVGLGVALLRQFPGGMWLTFYGALILSGALMTLEGFYWSFPGREAGIKSREAVQKTEKRPSIWDFMFRPFDKHISLDDLPSTLSIQGSYAPGVWGTTGLALERTLIADRRNLKSRLRTVMARARTGMALIRTGTSVFAVGSGLMVYFGMSSLLWSLFNAVLILAGLILITDGYYWYLPAEKTKKQFPYCYGDMEIVFPDYGKPSMFWKKVVFSHEDL